MNGAELVARCAARYDDAAFSIVSSAEWYDHVNHAYREFMRIAFPDALVSEENLTITANASTGVLPTASLNSDVVGFYISGRRLEPLPPTYPPATVQHWIDRPSTPLYYTLTGSRVRLIPAWAAGGTLAIAYVAAPTAVSAGTSPACPAIYHDAIAAGALAHQYRDDDNDAMARMYDTEFMQAVHAVKGTPPAPTAAGTG